MIRLILPALLAAVVPVPGVHAATAAPETCLQTNAAGTDWPVLARLDPVRTIPADVDSGAPGPVSDATGSEYEVGTYIRLHQEVAAGDARSRLMPWPEIRSLAP